MSPFKSAVAPNPRRVQLLGIMAALILAGCATDSRDAVTRREILQPWTEITGFQAGTSPQGLPAQMNSPRGAGYIALRRPAAMSARENDIYLLDAGLRRIFRYDNFRQTLTPFATTLSVEAGMSIYAAPDMSVYVTDPAHEQVLHFNRDGTFRYAFGADALSEPGTIAVSRDNMVFISDNFDHTIRVYRGQKTKGNNLVLADKIGGVGAAPGSFNGIGGLAAADDLLYVADSLNSRVQIMLIDPRAPDTEK